MDKLFKLTIMISLLTVSVSVLYYFVVFLPDKEETRRADEFAQQEKAEAKEAAMRDLELEFIDAKKEMLTSCLLRADGNYNTIWNQECKELGRLTSECEEILFGDYTEYVEKYGTVGEVPFATESLSVFYKKQDDCVCRLPTETADRFGEMLDSDKEDCFRVMGSS